MSYKEKEDQMLSKDEVGRVLEAIDYLITDVHYTKYDTDPLLSAREKLEKMNHLENNAQS